MAKVTVLGGGGWAIALAKVLYKNNNDVTIWSFLQSEVDALNKERENKISLPGIKIPDEIQITNDMEEAVKDSEMIVMAVASSFVRSTAKSLKGIVKEGQIIVDVAKGIGEVHVVEIRSLGCTLTKSFLHCIEVALKALVNRQTKVITKIVNDLSSGLGELCRVGPVADELVMRPVAEV